MESPRDIQDSKRFRWVGRPSEEELRGPLLPARRPIAVSLRPAPRPAPVQSPVDPFQAAPRWRFQGRDLFALAAIAVAVWFAIRGAEGLPFHHTGSVAPAEAADQVVAQITLDRDELRALPRTAAIAAASGPGSAKGGASETEPGSSGSGSKTDPKPPPPGGSTPLLQATVPGVGTITVDEPELPLIDDTPLRPLPDTGQLAQGTTTLPLL